MGCVLTKEDYEEDIRELSISISELPYIEPIKTQEQKRIENIQTIFREEYKNKNLLYR